MVFTNYCLLHLPYSLLFFYLIFLSFSSHPFSHIIIRISTSNHPIISFHFISYHILWYHITSCHIITFFTYHIMPYHIISNPVISCHNIIVSKQLHPFCVRAVSCTNFVRLEVVDERFAEWMSSVMPLVMPLGWKFSLHVCDLSVINVICLSAAWFFDTWVSVCFGPCGTVTKFSCVTVAASAFKTPRFGKAIRENCRFLSGVNRVSCKLCLVWTLLDVHDPWCQPCLV